MGACPKCGAPAGDTELACRNCGASFVPDASAIVPAGYSVQSFTGQSGQSPNPYAAPGAFPGAASPLVTSAEASSAMWYAVLGLFCFGFIFGPMAISRATRARQTIAANPGMEGSTQASIGYYLGWFDVLSWVLWLLSFVLHRR